MKTKRAQSLLESTLAYVAGMCLLGGIIAIWAIGNAQIPIRQITYEISRVMAGQPRGRQVDENGAQRNENSMPLWPTYVTAGF